MKKILTAILVFSVATICLATLSTTYEPEQYNTNGSTTQFQIQWGFFDTTDLTVIYTDSAGTDTTLTEGSGADKYTVYAPNSDYSSGATITTGTTYPSSGKITITRTVPYGQDLSINGDFVPAKPLETQLDKLAAQIQQTEDSIGRTLTIPVTDASGLTTELPNAETRANKTVLFDASGNIGVVTLTDSGTIAVDDDTLELTTNNIIQIKASGVDTPEINALAVTQAKMATNAVANYAITNSTITTAKLASKTGSDTNVVTGTAGTADYVVKWNGDGDVVDGYAFYDQDNMASNSATAVASQQSIKAYVDDNVYDSTNNYFTSTNSAFPSANTGVTEAHGLGSSPLFYQAILVCTNAVGGWAVGDESILGNNAGDSTQSAVTWANATNVGFFIDGFYAIPDRDGDGQIDLSTAGTDFNIKLRAWK